MQIPAGPLVIIKPAAIDFSITFPPKSSTLSEAGVVTGAAARQTEEKKRRCNDHISSKLGRKCATLVVETLGAWGGMACQFSQSYKPIPLRLPC